MIRLKHCNLVEAVECLVVGEILRFPFVSFCLISVRIGTQGVAEFKPEALRVIFRIELAEPAFLIFDRDNIGPCLRIVGEQIRYRCLIDMRVDLTAGRAEVVRHHIGRTIGQDLEIAHILTRCRHIGPQLDAALLCANQLAVVVDLRNAEGSMMRVSCPVVMLVAANAGNEDVVVKPIEPSLVDVAADARIAAEFQRAVVLNVVLHQKAVVVGIVAAKRVYGGCHIELFPHGEQCFAMHRRFFGITSVSVSRHAA